MLPGFAELSLDDFGGLHTLEDFRDVPAQLGSPGPCENVEFLSSRGMRSRSGTVTAFDLTAGSAVKHAQIYIQNAGSWHLLLLMDDGKLYESTGGARTLVFGTPPAGTTHFKVVAYGNKAYIFFSDGITGLGEPIIWDGTNTDALTVEGQSKGSLAAADSGTAGEVTAGVKRLSIVYETRHGFRIPASPSGLLTSTGTNPADGDTVLIAFTTYTFKATLGAAFDVKIGATASDTLDNLKSAINDTGVEGTDYGTGTTAHPIFLARAKTATTLVVEALIVNMNEGNLGLAESSAQLAWSGGRVVGGTYDIVATSYVEVTAAGSLSLDVSGFPVHADAQVTKRHAVMTESALLKFHVAHTIDDNSTTSFTFDISDASLVGREDVTDLFDVKQPGPSAKNGVLYHERMVFLDGSDRVWVSEPALPHTIFLTTGFIDVYADNEDRPNSAHEIRDVLYLVKSQKWFYTQDNGDDPVDWPLGELSDSLGSISPWGVDSNAAEQWLAIADFKSAYVWQGGEPVDIGLQIKADWDTQNYANMHKALTVIDPLGRRIFFFLPTGASTIPNTMFMCDYTRGLHPDRVRWSVWKTVGAAWNGFLADYKFTPGGAIRVIVYAESALIRRLDTTATADNGTAFTWKYRFGYFEPAFTGLSQFAGVELKATGGGSLAITVLGPDAASLATPTALTLAATPGKDARRLFNVWKERVFVELSQTSMTAVFRMNRFTLYSKSTGMRLHT